MAGGEKSANLDRYTEYLDVPVEAGKVVFTERLESSVAFVYTKATVCFCADAQRQVFFRSYRKGIVCFCVCEGVPAPDWV
jgi:hypothetical protein